MREIEVVLRVVCERREMVEVRMGYERRLGVLIGVGYESDVLMSQD